MVAIIFSRNMLLFTLIRNTCFVCRVYVSVILLLGNVGEFILDYTASKNSIIQLSYVIKFDDRNIDTYRRGIIVGLCSLQYRQY